jgi:hypothetical protein
MFSKKRHKSEYQEKTKDLLQVTEVEDRTNIIPVKFHFNWPSDNQIINNDRKVKPSTSNLKEAKTERTNILIGLKFCSMFSKKRHGFLKSFRDYLTLHLDTI